MKTMSEPDDPEEATWKREERRQWKRLKSFCWEGVSFKSRMCVCVCVCERERERKRERGGVHPLSLCFSGFMVAGDISREIWQTHITHTLFRSFLADTTDVQ